MAVLTGKALRNYIVREAKARGLDPRAVLAIISVEGGFYGAVGDHGTSFGPFQLHEGGALPKGISGKNARAWAQSEKGIDYALNAIAGVAGGKSGYAAVKAIAYSFERPADPAAEVTKAMAAYGGGLPAGSSQMGQQAQQAQQSVGGPSASAVAESQTVSALPTDMSSLGTAEQSQPAIFAPGSVQATSSAPQQQQSTWQLLASQPLTSQETQALYRRVQLAGGQ